MSVFTYIYIGHVKYNIKIKKKQYPSIRIGARVQISPLFILPTKKGHLSVSFSVGGDGEI